VNSTTERLEGVSDSHHRLLLSTAHVLAAAVVRLWPQAKVARGGVTSVPFVGFFYDFDLPRALTPDDLLKITRAMEEITRADLPLETKILPRAEALTLLRERSQDLRAESLDDAVDDAVDDNVRVCSCGDFVDVTPATELLRTSECRFFHLYREVKEAFWGGRSFLPLQRLHGIAHSSAVELRREEGILERGMESDHRWIGKALRLYEPLRGTRGDFVWLPHGMTVYNLLLEGSRALLAHHGFLEIRTPNRGGDYRATPVYASEARGGTQLPLRYFELTTEERRGPVESSGGLRHSRRFTRDRETVFCRPEQIEDEVRHLVELIRKPYELFDIGIGARVVPSAHVPGATDLERALDEMGIATTTGEEAPSLPGPRIEFSARNAFGSFEFDSGSIQIDTRLAERETLSYVDTGGTGSRPVVIHASVYGSLEAFLSSVVEKTLGFLPFWLAPIQARLISVSTDTNNYAGEIHDRLVDAGVRSDLDTRVNKIQAKLRDAIQSKIPYVVVVGDRELETGTVTVHPQAAYDSPYDLGVEEFLDKVGSEPVGLLAAISGNSLRQNELGP